MRKRFLMNLEKLNKDWREDEQIKFLAFETVEDLAAHLRKCHAEAMAGEFGPLGYLYKQQTLRLRELTKELEYVRSKQIPS